MANTLFADNMLALRLLVLLTTPFENTEAFKLGVIDKNGKYLVPPKNRTPEQKQSVSYLDRLVWNVKKMLNKLPGGENKLKNLVAASILIKETLDGKYTQLTESYVDTVNFDSRYAEERKKMICLWKRFLQKEEIGVGAIAGVGGRASEPTNTTAGIDINDKPLGFSLARRRKKYVD